MTNTLTNTSTLTGFNYHVSDGFGLTCTTITKIEETSQIILIKAGMNYLNGFRKFHRAKTMMATEP